jgi:hypothetical protein
MKYQPGDFVHIDCPASVLALLTGTYDLEEGVKGYFTMICFQKNGFECGGCKCTTISAEIILDKLNGEEGAK